MNSKASKKNKSTSRQQVMAANNNLMNYIKAVRSYVLVCQECERVDMNQFNSRAEAAGHAISIGWRVVYSAEHRTTCLMCPLCAPAW